MMWGLPLAWMIRKTHTPTAARRAAMSKGDFHA
jgi:hypothetical protein